MLSLISPDSPQDLSSKRAMEVDVKDPFYECLDEIVDHT